MPVATRPAVSPASETPTPPGMGSTPAKTVTTVLISTASAMPTSAPVAAAAAGEGEPVEDLGERVAADHHRDLAGRPQRLQALLHLCDDRDAPCCGASAPPARRPRRPPGPVRSRARTWRSRDSRSPRALVRPKSSVPSPKPQMISSRPICTMKLAAESIALTPDRDARRAADPLEEPHHHREPADGARHGQPDVGDDVLQLRHGPDGQRHRGGPHGRDDPGDTSDLRHHEADQDAAEREGLRPRRRPLRSRARRAR